MEKINFKQIKSDTEGPDVITLSKETICNHSWRKPFEIKGNETMKQFLGPKRYIWRDPSYNSIVNINEGFRAVYDNRIDMDSEWNKQILQILKKDFNVDISKLRQSYCRKKSYTTNENKKAYWTYSKDSKDIVRWNSLHSDYYEVSSYVYTAILYLEDEENLIGGETGFADEIKIENKTIKVTKGIVVEPKKGRLVLFSGGDNYHSPLQVYEGKRNAYHVWFTIER